MDEIALQTLREEMLDDARVATGAYAKARDRFTLGTEVGYEACAHHLSRMFNAFEQMGLRVAKTFENNIDDEQGWHAALLKRLALCIEGVRPALIPKEMRQPLAELKAFRHIVHAYDLELDPEKLKLLLGYAERVASGLHDVVLRFVRHVAKDQGLSA
ncbi:MAG: hypothetical protein M3R59_03110 [Verrucomicrobiota bacterium]|nr:hypothetical protein [Verrucomicrobiota bacterium]